MKTIAKHLALVMLVMFNLQASAQTCSFMQALGGVNDQFVPSQVIPTSESSVHPSPLPAIPLGGSSSKSGSVSSPAQSSPVYTFKKTTSITSGRRYMIVREYGINYAACSKSITSPGHVTSKVVNVIDETITTDDGNLIFTIENHDDKGFTIRQSDGLYWSYSGSGTKINVGESLTEMGYWSITFGSELPTITNIKKHDYNVIFDTNNKLFKVRQSSSYRPNLYEEILTEVPVSVSPVGYATLYYEDRALKVPEGVTAMTYAYNETAQSLVVSKTYEAGSVIPAGVAVVLKAQPGEYTFTVIDEEGEKPASTNLFGYSVPSKTRVSGMSKYYMLSLNAQNDPNSVGFYWGYDKGGAFKSGAHKAFLALPESATAKSFTFADVADGITSVSRGSDDSDAPVYSLAGIRMSGKLPAGIYLRGGKKFVVK